MLCGALGCGPGEAKAPNALHPIDERRAIELISKAIASEKAEPDGGRDERVPGSGKVFRVTVGVKGKRYGIAYVTAEEAATLGDLIPPPE